MKLTCSKTSSVGFGVRAEHLRKLKTLTCNTNDSANTPHTCVWLLLVIKYFQNTDTYDI